LNLNSIRHVCGKFGLAYKISTIVYEPCLRIYNNCNYCVSHYFQIYVCFHTVISVTSRRACKASCKRYSKHLQQCAYEYASVKCQSDETSELRARVSGIMEDSVLSSAVQIHVDYSNVDVIAASFICNRQRAY